MAFGLSGEPCGSLAERLRMRLYACVSGGKEGGVQLCLSRHELHELRIDASLAQHAVDHDTLPLSDVLRALARLVVEGGSARSSHAKAVARFSAIQEPYSAVPSNHF